MAVVWDAFIAAFVHKRANTMQNRWLRASLAILLYLLVLTVLAVAQSQNLPDAPRPQKTVPPPEPPAAESSSRSEPIPVPSVQPRVDQPANLDPGRAPGTASATPPSTTIPNPDSPDQKRLYTISSTV